MYVTPAINGVEGSPGGIFKIPTSGYPATYRSAFLEINYSPLVDGLELHKYLTKFIWPADLDGDGEYDYVVDRLFLQMEAPIKFRAICAPVSCLDY